MKPEKQKEHIMPEVKYETPFGKSPEELAKETQEVESVEPKKPKKPKK